MATETWLKWRHRGIKGEMVNSWRGGEGGEKSQGTRREGEGREKVHEEAKMRWKQGRTGQEGDKILFGGPRRDQGRQV